MPGAVWISVSIYITPSALKTSGTLPGHIGVFGTFSVDRVELPDFCRGYWRCAEIPNLSPGCPSKPAFRFTTCHAMACYASVTGGWYWRLQASPTGIFMMSFSVLGGTWGSKHAGIIIPKQEERWKSVDRNPYSTQIFSVLDIVILCIIYIYRDIVAQGSIWCM